MYHKHTVYTHLSGLQLSVVCHCEAGTCIITAGAVVMWDCVVFSPSSASP